MSEALKISHITEIKPLYSVKPIASVKEMLVYLGQTFGDKTAIKYRREPQANIESKSYKELSSDVNALGSMFLQMGFDNYKVAIIGENRYEWIVSYLAVINGAGIAVPLDRMLPANELDQMLKRGEVDAIVYSHSFHDTILKIAENNKNLKACICMNPQDDVCPENSALGSFYTFDDLLQRGEALVNEGFQSYIQKTIDSKALSILLFTSGTSSTSKAVMLSHENICSDIMAIGGIFHANSNESVLSILPLHHTFENTTGLLFPLYLGMTIAISDGLKYLSKNLVEYKPDVLVGVPLIFDKFKNRITDELKKKKMDKKVQLLMRITNGLRYVGLDLRKKLFKKLLEAFGGHLRAIITGGAGMEAQTARWYENVGVKVYQGYGLTETSPVAAGCNDRIRKPGTCGEPLPGVKLAIANPDSSGSGEIVIKGKTVMLGYWKDEEATRESIKDGWFHTGDLGTIDKKGLIHVTGRVKSMIVLKTGKKVFPEELEFHINKLEYVKESIVWGETAADGTVDICAKIILDNETILNHTASPDDEVEIKRLLDAAIKDINKLMPPYKMIRYFVYSYDELVKTTTLKVKRYIETDQIQMLFKQLTTNIKNAAGRNIDKLKEMLSKRAVN